MDPRLCLWTHCCSLLLGLPCDLAVLLCVGSYYMASFSIRVSMFPFARCSWFCLLDPSFPLFSCDLASFRKGAQLSPLKVRVRSLPPRDVLTVIASHCCLLRYLSVPSLLGTYFSAVLASVREKKPPPSRSPSYDWL